ncbi:MAG: ComF family protein [Candidatus Babeliales bacterium]
MLQALPRIYAEFKYLFWPNLCASCKLFLRNDELLCIQCARAITPVVSVPLEVTANVIMQVYAVSAYQGTLKRLVLAKAWHDERASVVLGKLLWHNTTLPHIPFDLIVPIPLHWRRFAQRGYNQAELMAKELSGLSGKPTYLALERIQSTVFQSSLSGEERRKNVKVAFKLHAEYKELIRGKRVLLVDDLMTSGATLQAAARLIVKCKPESIKAAVGGRVV